MAHGIPRKLGTPSFGQRKTEPYGQSILDALAQFRSGARVSAPQ
jgi:hypothetical protein